jgi:mono/diheme cytochrome c family protein
MKALIPIALFAEQPAALPPDPDAQLTAIICSACHSINYVTSQPRGKGAQFWNGSVAKMVKIYGAPIEAEVAARISTYLATTYGAPPDAGKR